MFAIESLTEIPFENFFSEEEHLKTKIINFGGRDYLFPISLETNKNLQKLFHKSLGPKCASELFCKRFSENDIIRPKTGSAEMDIEPGFSSSGNPNISSEIEISNPEGDHKIDLHGQIDLGGNGNIGMNYTYQAEEDTTISGEISIDSNGNSYSGISFEKKF